MYEIVCCHCKHSELSPTLSINTYKCPKCGRNAFTLEHPKVTELDYYQKSARTTAIYKNPVIYPALGLAGEAGEVCEKIKKILRDEETTFDDIRKQKTDIAIQKLNEIAKEIGDVLWYCANLCEDLGLSLSDVATLNIAKLLNRKQRNKIHGSGDNR